MPYKYIKKSIYNLWFFFLLETCMRTSSQCRCWLLCW